MLVQPRLSNAQGASRRLIPRTVDYWATERRTMQVVLKTITLNFFRIFDTIIVEYDPIHRERDDATQWDNFLWDESTARWAEALPTGEDRLEIGTSFFVTGRFLIVGIDYNFSNMTTTLSLEDNFIASA